jgi:hypothetical protein
MVICAYIDDSGNTGSNLDDLSQPKHWVGALLVPEKCWEAVRNKAKEIETYARNNGYAAQQFELNGQPLFNGNKEWKGVLRNSRMQIYEDCITAIEELDLRLVLGCCNKALLKKRYAYPEHPQLIAFWLCLERIATYSNGQGSLALLVADEGSYFSKRISKKVLDDYRTMGPPFGNRVDLSCVIDTVHFMGSDESPHIQFCDVCLYALHRWDCQQDVNIQKLAQRVQARVFSERTFPY